MTRPEILIIGKLLLTFVVLLGIPLWELYALRRDRLRSEREDANASSGGSD